MFLFQPQISNGTSSVIVSRKRPSEGNYEKEKDLCIKYFDQWSESDQVEFVEHLISRMCHYQHGHINSYLKPMLQRDFITALPGKSTAWSQGCSGVCSPLGTSSSLPLSLRDPVPLPRAEKGSRVAESLLWLIELATGCQCCSTLKYLDWCIPKNLCWNWNWVVNKSWVSTSFALRSFFIQKTLLQRYFSVGALVF